MPSIDLPLAQLWSYKPATTEQPDFDRFWQEALSEARSLPLDVDLQRTGPDLAGVSCYRALFTSLGGARVAGWYARPSGPGRYPGVAEYHGYSGRGARPLELYNLAAQGVAVLSMDCRGQGGDTPDIPALDGGHQAGWLTRGLRDPRTHYYKYVFCDAVRAVDALASLEEVDEARIATTGLSQGGGLSLAAAALSGRVSFVWSDIPFLCDFPRAVEITGDPPYTEVSSFLRRHPEVQQAAFSTLSYFDIANHAPRLACPVRVTAGLWDATCPPSTIFGMFNRLASSDKQMVVLPYHGHEVTYEVVEQRFAEILRRLNVADGRSTAFGEV